MKQNDLKTIDAGPSVELLKRILSRMVSHPENLVIDHVGFTASAKVTIQAHAADTPRLIGERAVNYRSISVLFQAICATAGFRVHVLPIKEPSVGTPDRYKFEANKNWPAEEILELLDETARAVFQDPDAIKIEATHSDADVSSTVELFCSKGERPELLALIGPAIERIFDAIGRANGRLLYLSVIPNREPVLRSR